MTDEEKLQSLDYYYDAPNDEIKKITVQTIEDWKLIIKKRDYAPPTNPIAYRRWRDEVDPLIAKWESKYERV